jgi:predicted nucleic acid-binding protein
MLRYLTGDDPVKAAACYSLFQRLKSGQEEVTSSEVLLHEALYVLTSPRHYRLSHPDAAARLRPLLTLRGFKLLNKRVYLRALDLYASNASLDFGDAVAIARMENLRIGEIYSYDTDFDSLPGVSRIEP